MTLNFLQLSETDYRFLYHANYKVSDPSHYNTSLEFKTPAQEAGSEQLKLCKALLDEIRAERRLGPNELNTLKSCISQVKAIDVLGYKAEEELSHLLNY